MPVTRTILGQEQRSIDAPDSVSGDDSVVLIERFVPARSRRSGRIRTMLAYVLLSLSLVFFTIFGFCAIQLTDMYGDTSIYGAAPAVSTALWAVFSFMIHELLLILAFGISGVVTTRSRMVRSRIPAVKTNTRITT